MTGLVPLVEPLQTPGNAAEVAERFLDLPYLLFLDSATGAGSGSAEARRLGRFSFLSADPAIVVRSKGTATEVLRDGTWRRSEGDALGVARAMLSDARIEPVPGLPPFQGGAAGYIGYDYGAVLERIPPTRYDDLALPDVVLGLYDWVIAWDHQAGAAWIVSLGLPGGGPDRERRARQRLEMVRGRAAGRRDRRLRTPAAGQRPAATPGPRRPAAPRSLLPRHHP